jgi:putative SOS response-associated peptidase YedK
MCGRYVFNPDKKFSERFGLGEVNVELSQNFNVTPESVMPIVVGTGGGRRLEEAKWGLRPEWLNKDKGFINARIETLLSKPSFKSEVINNRCIVPVSGYYEWQSGAIKQPYYFFGDEMLGLAVIYNETANEKTFAIITKRALPEYMQIHERMPVIISKSNQDKWFTGSNVNELLAEVEKEKVELKYHPVGLGVNNVGKTYQI